MAREARQHELELKKLELSQQNQPLNDESGRRVEIGPKIQLTQITTKFDEKHDEISLYLINFERKAELAQVPKKDWVAYLLVVLPAELSNMLAREPTERADNYDFVKDLILKRPQCDQLKKTLESISHVVTDKSFDELMARYTSLGKVNEVEMKILRDTGATLDLICNKYEKPHMYTNEKVWLRTPLEESLICLPLAEVELDCEMGHVITKAAVLRDSLDQGRYLLGNKTAALLEDYKTKEDVQMHMINAVQTRAQKKLLEVENEVQGQSIEQFDEELNDDLSEDEKKTIEEVLPVVKELSVQDLIKTSPKVFGEEQHKSKQLKPLIADTELNVSKENKYVLEKICYSSIKETKMERSENF
ncbi:SCAN box domain-containing protein [Trichonephila inaurata madagascariensis]|uniref:SCAN box domain-containing protein n=1 Tax=Trichonephila inaurata madagascariensis TaxID=2747483 RepID=A0A8X7CRY0_9ARAC|nr:SCAN box domain-containing protein [Trichonephila inaurata madagascariensis]